MIASKTERLARAASTCRSFRDAWTFARRSVGKNLGSLARLDKQSSNLAMPRTHSCARMRSTVHVSLCCFAMHQPSALSSTGTAIPSSSYHGLSPSRKEVGIHGAHCSSCLYQSGSLALSIGKICPSSEKSSMLHPGLGRSLKIIAESGINEVSELRPIHIASGSIRTLATAFGSR